MRPPAVDRAGSLQTGTPEMFSRGAVAVAPMRFIPTMVSTAPRASRACRRLRVRCRAVWSELPNASGQPAQVLRSTVERAAGILAFEPPSWQAFVCPQGVAQPKSSSWWTRRESPCSEAPLIILDGDCHGFRGWRIPNRIYARSSAAPRKLVDLADLWSAQPARIFRRPGGAEADRRAGCQPRSRSARPGRVRPARRGGHGQPRDRPVSRPHWSLPRSGGGGRQLRSAPNGPGRAAPAAAPDDRRGQGEEGSGPADGPGPCAFVPRPPSTGGRLAAASGCSAYASRSAGSAARWRSRPHQAAGRG